MCCTAPVLSWQLNPSALATVLMKLSAGTEIRPVTVKHTEAAVQANRNRMV
jgi:hypothetical protein